MIELEEAHSDPVRDWAPDQPCSAQPASPVTALKLVFADACTGRIGYVLEGVAGEVKIYPGIDIDVPVLGEGTKPTDKRTQPDDVRKAIRAAFSEGADGVVLSREYVEMWLANLTAAGDTLRELFAQSAR